MARKPQIAPFGSWRSPISAELYGAGEIWLQQLHLAEGDLYWSEIQPDQGGRYAILRRSPDGSVASLLPADYNARTTVHEYGGGSYLVSGRTIFFSNFADQRLYRLDPGKEPRPITPVPVVPAGLRYADGVATPEGQWILCVRENHTPEGPVINEIVVVPADGASEPRAIVTGRDFYSSPRISPDGNRLVWLTWDFPQMPWDGTEVWTAEVLPDGSIRGPRRVAGGPEESIYQPEWGPDGTLYFVSDRTGWWNLYREQGSAVVALAPIEADIGFAHWAFGYQRYAVLGGGRIACVYSQRGFDHLGLITPGTERIENLAADYTCFFHPYLISNGRDQLWFVAGSPHESRNLVTMQVATGKSEVLRCSLEEEINADYISEPRAIEFPTEGGLTAHALFYPPANRDFAAPPGERPPLVVISHGGPTSHALSYLDPEIQYFTSRGLAVVDVNYGGSTGYGRAYRQRLNGQWGVVDVADCANAARYLAAQGEADGARMAIRGGSAGGYTTLSALTFSDVFAAGASYYGISDLEIFTHDTHKYESHYLDVLVGHYPEKADLYRSRSPIHHTDRLSCPMVLFQGLEDKIVPPSQAEMMVRALQAKGLPYAYLAFEGEQHGFRRKETNVRCLGAELYFYGRIFGFEPADRIEPVKIENLPEA